MVYQTNIPIATDSPGKTSRAQLVENFTQLNNQFQVNHIAWTAVADNGKHTKIEFDTNHAAGAPAGTQSEIYTAGATPQLYFQNAANISLLSGIWAWCMFNGAAADPIAITSGYNVTNVSKLSATTYTINFTNPLPNANYGVLCTASTGTTPFAIGLLDSFAPTVNAVRIINEGSNTSRITVLILGS